MSDPQALALANHMLASIQKDLATLKENQFLNAQTYNEICGLLPSQFTDSQQHIRPPLPSRKSGASPSPQPRELPSFPKLPARRQTQQTPSWQPSQPAPSPSSYSSHPPPALSPPSQQPTPTLRTATPSFPKAQPASEASPPPSYAAVEPASIATAEALYDYVGDEPSTDLSFRKGDIIQVTEYVNEDWWRGSLNGKSGIFPQNHVKKIPTSSLAAKPRVPPVPSPTGSSSVKSAMPSNLPPYSYPAPPTAMYHQPPPPGQPPVAQYAPPPVVAAQEISGAPNPDGENKVHNMAKKFGGHVATAATWGFGATIGSQAANAIF
ncbi:SH3 domain-containing protein [Radiomyces spectabilis]|uniref:SH3 domain-containing protein n=1 Tax=Radiomyces spectabilis TaxID=64574 RepID=UPI00221FF7A5|nr:SH3 domain-containing protein [Radiomyces spectabilis]KAI8379489.1 SH3 domain-containing protein [Radiomyces spectabilis]